MPADLDLHLRDAGTWDATTVADVLTTAIAATSAAPWIQPSEFARARQLQTRLTSLVREQIPRRRVRVADHDGQLIAAMLWTTCLQSGHLLPEPAALLLDLGGDAQRSRLLDATLTDRHPTRPHHHLLAIGVRPERQRHGIGTALLDDWHHHVAHPAADTFMIAPNTLLKLARTTGYHDEGPPITAMISAAPLYPLSRPSLIGNADQAPVTAGRHAAARWAQ